MSRRVAVDGGQTGLRLRCVPGGRVGHGPGFSFRVESSVVDAVGTAAAEAGLDGPVDVACLGLSGLPAESWRAEALAAAIGSRLNAAEVRLCNDMVTAHAGALAGEPGIVLTAGTGVACLAVDADAGHHRVDGWGHLFGDAGSAFDIGRSGLAAVQRHRDGRGEPTLLTEASSQSYGTAPELLPQRLYTSAAVVSEVAGFAPRVFECARDGDRVAADIVGRAVQCLAETAVTAVNRFPGNGPVLLACTGGLWNAGDRLREPFEALVAEGAPRARIVRPRGDPLDGAERLATGRLGRYADLVRVLRRPAPATRAMTGPAAGPTGGSADGPFARGALIVSCQAQPDSPLYGPEMMAAMARAAISGGAAGIRANGPADVAAIRRAVDVPLIGIFKQGERSGVYITPTRQAAAEIAGLGADIVAVDGTMRPRLDGCSLEAQIRFVHEEWGILVMADVDSYEAGLAAREAGADLVATTLAGYTGPGAVPDRPDLDLVARLATVLDRPVIAEGRYRTGADVRAALDAGAHAVVVGTAITNPTAITARIRRGIG